MAFFSRLFFLMMVSGLLILPGVISDRSSRYMTSSSHIHLSSSPLRIAWLQLFHESLRRTIWLNASL